MHCIADNAGCIVIAVFVPQRRPSAERNPNYRTAPPAFVIHILSGEPTLVSKSYQSSYTIISNIPCCCMQHVCAAFQYAWVLCMCVDVCCYCRCSPKPVASHLHTRLGSKFIRQICWGHTVGRPVWVVRVIRMGALDIGKPAASYT